MADTVEPFHLEIEPAVLADLKLRLQHTRWPERETVTDWRQGVPLAAMQALCAYWQQDYDWRKCEQKLNAAGQFRTEIDGLAIHFLHKRSPHAEALPLILTHGWPGSVVEFLEVIGPLTDPAAHGGDPADAFHVVVPSLPGFGFSGKPTATGWGVERIAAAWASLMRRLGYTRYVAQGGDWGSIVTQCLARDSSADECPAVHINMATTFPGADDMTDMTEAEKSCLAGMQFYNDHDSGYSKQQGTRPQTLGYALVDSPAGQAAWIYEKFHAWTDHAGTPETALSRDAMLNNITLYWLTATAASSARLYWESFENFKTPEITRPLGVSIFPKEIFRPSRRWAERYYKNIVYWNELSQGGHFAAFEQPVAYVEEVRKCFRAFRS
jgi:pimeloyl-ACP methyl ester carboxylesterase